MSIPAGPQPVARFLRASALPRESAVVLLGLGGGLQPEWRVGELGLYQDCQTTYPPGQRYAGDRALLAWLAATLGARPAAGLCSDRLLARAGDKQAAAQTYQAAIVDMESAPVLAYFQRAAVLRVISDDCQSTVPDLAPAFDAQGQLRPGAIARCFAREPLAAARLIRSSLRGLAVLTEVAARLGEAIA